MGLVVGLVVRLVAGSLTSMFAGEGPAAREHVATGVHRWMEDLNEALEPHLRAPLEWDEDQQQEWSVDLAETAHRALLLLAAHAQETGHPWPDEVPPRVDTDPAFREISAGNFARCHYPQVVIPRFWVPGDFALTIEHTLPDGEEVVLGSLGGLVAQLLQLNRNTLQLAKAALIDRQPTGAGFLDQAACGLSVFVLGADEASVLGVPLALT